MFLASLKKLRLAAALSLVALMPVVANAQTSLFNSNGFEPPYALANINNQFGWSAQGSAGAGFVVNTTVNSGTQSFRINGPSLTGGGLGGSGSSFWVQLLAPNLGASFKPVAAGKPVLIVNWKQFLTGSSGDITTMPFSGIHIEGYRADGQSQMTTEISIDINDSVGIFDGFNVIPGPSITNLRNNWIDLSASLDYTTQSVSVKVNGLPYLSDIPFANYIPAQSQADSIGVAEADIFAVNGLIFAGAQSTNQAFFDNFNVTAVAVPEPAVFVLGGAGIGLFGFWYWRRQRNIAEQMEQWVSIPE